MGEAKNNIFLSVASHCGPRQTLVGQRQESTSQEQGTLLGGLCSAAGASFVTSPTQRWWNFPHWGYSRTVRTQC